MSTSLTPNFNLEHPNADENLLTSNGLIKTSLFAIDAFLKTLFDDKANAADVYTQTEVDTAITTAVDGKSILAEYVGDATVPLGSNVITLKTIDTLSPGVGSKFTVNEKGLVTKREALILTDISNYNEVDAMVKTRDIDDTADNTTIDKVFSAKKILELTSGITSTLNDYLIKSNLRATFASLADISGTNCDLLDGEHGSFYSNWNNINSTPTTLAGYGIVDAFDGEFGSLSLRPTSISGYGITDAYTKGEVEVAIDNKLVPSHTSTVSRPTSGLLLGDFNWDDTLNAPTWWDGTDWYESFDGNFSSLSAVPTTIAGFGITDAYTKTEMDGSTRLGRLGTVGPSFVVVNETNQAHDYILIYNSNTTQFDYTPIPVPLVIDDSAQAATSVYSSDKIEQIINVKGTTTNRPVGSTVGQLYYDTDLKQPIWYDGSTWKFADGTAA